MRILIQIPVSIQSTRGNRITGTRWQELLTQLGHQVQLHGHSQLPDDATSYDCIFFLHATRSHASVIQVQRARGQSAKPFLIVCMTGTDLHRDFDPRSDDRAIRMSSEKVIDVWNSVDKIVLLEPEAQRKIPPQFHDKCSVIFQSATKIDDPIPPPSDSFRVCVIGHLRAVKDPFLTARAARSLPNTSRIGIVQIGAALTGEMQHLAEREVLQNQRYRWLGELSHHESLRQMTGSHLMVLSSINEGAPSVLAEAIVNRVPILATRIDATVGMLGSDYPGFFEVGDVSELTQLLSRVEADPTFVVDLKLAAEKLEHLYDPETERAALQEILSGVLANSHGRKKQDR